MYVQCTLREGKTERFPVPIGIERKAKSAQVGILHGLSGTRQHTLPCAKIERFPKPIEAEREKVVLAFCGRMC
jgi:hypothetical protein